jgi:hypothetical protein
MIAKLLTSRKAQVIGIGIVVGGVVLYYLQGKIKKYILALKDLSAKRRENRLLEDLGLPITFSESEFRSLATQLYDSVYWTWYYPNCDETTTQKILMKLQTDRDYVALAVAFGIRDNYTMEDWVLSCLNTSERMIVNQAWQSRGMKYRI